MKHIIEHLGGSHKKLYQHYKYFSATKLGSFFSPEISAQAVNLWLVENDFLEKNIDNEWIATQKGKPYLYRYDQEGSGTIYWSRKILEVIEDYQSELYPKELSQGKDCTEKEGNPHIKRMMEMLSIS